MAVKYANNATTILLNPIGASDSTLTVSTGTGLLFPALGPSDFCYVTLIQDVKMEIVKVTGISGDVLTIVRAQDGTTAYDFSAGAVAALYITKGLLDQLKLDAVTSPTILGGTANGLVLGGTTPAAGTLTDLTYTGALLGSTGVLNIGSGQIYKDASGNTGFGTVTPISKVHIDPGTQLTSGGLPYGAYISNTSLKTYPTSSWGGTGSGPIGVGLYQYLELGTSQTVNDITPGGFNFVYGFYNRLTKSAASTSDIERMYFNGIVSNFG